MKLYRAPELFPEDDSVKIFLAGSIEMGLAEDWQSRFSNELTDTNITILNPRRLDFDASQDQSITNPYFKQQVEWELAALESADLIFVYFDPTTKSPITLLELGLFNKKPIVVCCPDSFWRQGNIEIVCKWYDIPFTKDKDLFFERSIALCKTL